MWLMYEANCSSPHELLSLPFLPTGMREVMASEDGDPAGIYDSEWLMHRRTKCRPAVGTYLRYSRTS